MKKTAVAISLVAGMATAAFGFGTGAAGCSGECVSCHPIKKEEFVRLFKRIDPSAKVLSVTTAPVKGLYQVSVDAGRGQKGIVYVDYGKKNIISGKIIDISSKVDKTQETTAELNAKFVDPSKIPMSNAVIVGNPRGSKPLYVFTDPDCPYCAKLHEELKALIKEDPQLKVVVLLTPLKIHPEAEWKSQAIIQVSKTNMTAAAAMLDQAYQKKRISKVKGNPTATAGNIKVASQLGFTLTPTMVMPNGHVIVGYQSNAELKKHLITSVATAKKVRRKEG